MWFLAAFKIIKTWLPEKAVQRIKFLKKGGIDEYVPLDQALKCWGGNDDYVFSFESENVAQDTSAGDGVQNTPASNRKVGFLSIFLNVASSTPAREMRLLSECNQ